MLLRLSWKLLVQSSDFIEKLSSLVLRMVCEPRRAELLILHLFEKNTHTNTYELFMWFSGFEQLSITGTIHSDYLAHSFHTAFTWCWFEYKMSRTSRFLDMFICIAAIFPVHIPLNLTLFFHSWPFHIAVAMDPRWHCFSFFPPCGVPVQ